MTNTHPDYDLNDGANRSGSEGEYNEDAFGHVNLNNSEIQTDVEWWDQRMIYFTVDNLQCGIKVYRIPIRTICASRVALG